MHLRCRSHCDMILILSLLMIAMAMTTASLVLNTMLPLWMAGNVALDALSSRKYYHFVRLMGRAASNITLECALQTHPNITLIGEEVMARHQNLSSVTKEIAEVCPTCPVLVRACLFVP